MPQRSNDFQKLVYLIQKQLAERSDVVVTESKMLPDRNTGKTREVDISVETILNGIPLIVAFECRDRSRRPDISWVESMLKKHENLSDKLVLVTNLPFSTDASDLARRNGAETIEFSAAIKQHWPSALDGYTSLFFASFDFKVRTYKVEYDFQTGTPLLENAPVDVLDIHGVQAPIYALVQRFIEDENGVGTPVMDAWYQKPVKDRRHQHEATLQYVPPMDQPIILLQGQHQYKLTKLIVVVDVNIGWAPIEVKQSGFGELKVAHGATELNNGTLVGQSVRFVLTQEHGRPPTAAMMLTGNNGTKRELVRVFKPKIGS